MFSANPQYSAPNDTNLKSLHPLEDLFDYELFEYIQKSSVSASHAEKPKGVTPEILMKVWRINNATEKRNINVTSQLARQNSNTTLSRNFGTTLLLLEESTQWANRSELYLGFFKEEIGKDTREANIPLVF